MRVILKWARRILLTLVLAIIAVGIWKREDIARLMAVNSLFSADRIVYNFGHMPDLFFHAAIPRGTGQVSPLPQGAPAVLPSAVTNWVEDRAVTGLVVLKNGAIAYEDYYQGTEAEDLRISWSVAKSFLSALAGILIEDGTLSLDDPVTKWAPALKGSAYDGATLRNVLQMSSGVKFNEDYLDFNSDINRMGRVLALGGSMDGFAAGLHDSIRPPGEHWQYVSIDTHVVGMVIAGATGRSVVDLMSEKIIQPLGVEKEPVYLTDGRGVPFVLGGLNMTTRDYARFGQMIANGGIWQGRQIVPAHWVEASTVPSAVTDPDTWSYGYSWWIPVGAVPGEFMARGIYGQYIYINRPRGVVIAVNAADRHFEDPGVEDGDVAMFRQIADSL